MVNDAGQPDLAPITRHLRAMYRSRLLVAAVSHLRVLEQFGHQPIPSESYRISSAWRSAR